MVEKILFLQNGTLDLDRSVLTAGRGAGDRKTVPVYSTLVKAGEEYILIDTGLHPDGLTDPEGTWGARAKTVRPTIRKGENIEERLNAAGISCEMISKVILTHMHWDHTGGLKFFPHAKIVVQKAEHRYAFEPDDWIGGSYMKNHFDFPLDYLLVEGDAELCEGVDLLFTPGHTPGHQSVLLTMADGRRCIIPGDAVYSFTNISDRIPPGNCWGTQEAILSLDKLRTLSRLLNAKIYPSHDPDPDYLLQAQKDMQ